MINKVILTLSVVFLIGCVDISVPTPSPSITLLSLSEDTLAFIRSTSSDKPILYLPSLFGHEKLLYVPISYYSPVTDNSNVVLRILIPVIYDVDHGMVQPTSLNIYQCDSFKLDGTSLIFYSGLEASQVVSYPPQEGLYPTAPYTDSTVVILLYEDTTLQIIPNIRYTSEWLEIPEKPIIGLYFLVTDYYLN
jgi:hypothetical protein